MTEEKKSPNPASTETISTAASELDSAELGRGLAELHRQQTQGRVGDPPTEPDAARHGQPARRAMRRPDDKAMPEHRRGAATPQMAMTRKFWRPSGGLQHAQSFARSADALPAQDSHEEPGVSDSVLGRTLGSKYQVRRKLGEGGFGAVYEAEEAKLGRKVAIKTLHPHLTKNESITQRFLQEGIAASKLDHPGAVKIFDVGETPEGHLWLAMEFLRGQTLAELLTERGKLSARETLEILGPLCEILGEAHQKGLVHRDLKPQNLMLVPLRDKSIPKLLDFGIAKLAGAETHTQDGTSMGTPAYMAPEQWGNASQVTPAADVYSLGVLVYQMLSGRLPFQADNPRSWMHAHCMEDPAPLPPLLGGYQRALEAVLKKALAKDPEQRYPEASALHRALSDALTGSSDAALLPEPEKAALAPDAPVALAPDGAESFPVLSVASTPSPWRRALSLGALGVVMALGGFWLFSFPAPLENPPKPPVDQNKETPPQTPSQITLPEEDLKPVPVRVEEKLTLGFEVVQEEEDGEKRFLSSGDTLRSGDTFEARVTVSQDAYVYVVLLSSDGSSAVLLPEEGDLQLKADVPTRLPGVEEDWFILDDVPGYENLYFIVSDRPIEQSDALAAKTIEDVRAGRLRIAKPEALRAEGFSPRGFGLSPRGVFVGKAPRRQGQKLRGRQITVDEEGVVVVHFWLRHTR